MDTTAKKDMAQAMLKQVELKAKASGKAEAVNYYRDRLMNEVPKIKGIGPVLFQEISKALGFQEDNQN